MRNTTIAFIAAALTTVPALAETKPEAPVPVASSGPSQPAAQDKRYCVIESFTESRLPKKICKTRARWMEEDNFDPFAPRK